jgi:hypothetical protein
MVEETGAWRKLHYEELCDLCSSTNVIRMIWTGNVAYMEKKEMHAQFWWGNNKEREHLEDLGRDDNHIKLKVHVIGF